MKKSELMLYSCINSEIERLSSERKCYKEDDARFKKISESVKVLENRKNKIISFIRNIDDELIKEIFIYRYIQTERGIRSWHSVAIKVGGGNSADGVRKLHDRYLKKMKSQGE